MRQSPEKPYSWWANLESWVWVLLAGFCNTKPLEHSPISQIFRINSKHRDMKVTYWFMTCSLSLINHKVTKDMPRHTTSSLLSPLRSKVLNVPIESPEIEGIKCPYWMPWDQMYTSDCLVNWLVSWKDSCADSIVLVFYADITEKSTTNSNRNQAIRENSKHTYVGWVSYTLKELCMYSERIPCSSISKVQCA